MKVSRNELLQLCQKAFQGLDFPAGSDKDAAQLVSWLDAHRLPGTDLLHDDLPLLTTTPLQTATIIVQSPTKVILDGHGQSTLLVAASAIDLAIAKTCADEGQITTVLTGCRSPLFAMALPFSRDLGCKCLHIHWQQQNRHYSFLIDTEKQPFFYGDLSALLYNGLCDLSVTRIYGHANEFIASLNDERGPPTIDATEFASRAQATLCDGIDVDENIWAEMNKLARRILIPATTRSRAHGAGAHASDND